MKDHFILKDIKPCHEIANEDDSYEKVSFYTTFMAAIGFYFLLIIGFVNHLIFIPKGATEQNREVILF